MVALRVAVLGAASLMAAMFVRAVAMRLAFPYEIEWMCGSMLDHVDRVRAGLPIYTAPTASWIPFLYPPLFFWIAAPLGGSFLACRLVSIAATLVQAACIWRLARRGQATRFWAALGVLTFFAAYFYVGYWYDVERSDMLCMALVMGAVVLLSEVPTALGAALAGVVFGLAFFAKQQGLPFAAASALALALDRQWKRGLLLASATATIVVGGSAWQNAVTQGWFGYYVFKMPAAHGIDLRLWQDVFSYDVLRGPGLIVLTVALFCTLARDAWKGDRRSLSFALLLGTGGMVALSSRLHIGGWRNVLVPWVSFACPALAIAGARVERWTAAGPRRSVWLGALLAGVLAQLGLWVQSPDFQVPDQERRAETEQFLGDVRKLEEGGSDVLVVGRGHVTQHVHFQMSALADVVRMGGAPAGLLDALRTRRFAAIVDDARLRDSPPLGLWPAVMLEDVAEAREALFANYYVADRFDDRELLLTMLAPAMPRWVYRPRRHPLAEDGANVLPRHFAEMALADQRAAARRSGNAPTDSADDIEELAARETAAVR